MTVRNDYLIQKCFRKERTLSEFLKQADEEEILSVQISGMRYNESVDEVRRHDFQQTSVNSEYNAMPLLWLGRGTYKRQRMSSI